MMKKTLLTGLFCLFLSFLRAADGVSFSLVPKEFFTGDEVTALYTFTSNDASLAFLTEKGPFVFSSPRLFSSAGYDCLCSKMLLTGSSLSASQNTYVLSITFYPYAPGSIDIPPFDLGELLSSFLEADSSHTVTASIQSFSPIHIDIPPFTVTPILSKYPSESLRPLKGPLIIPGTTYVLYGIASLLILFAGFIIFICVHVEKIRTRISSLYHSLSMSVHVKRSLREVRKLQKKGMNIAPQEFAQRIMQILRTFLEKRYFMPFSCTCTEEITALFYDKFQNAWTPGQQDAVHSLYELFLRCDFIRFSNVQKDLHTLSTDERKRLLQKANDLLLFFEKGDHTYA